MPPPPDTEHPGLALVLMGELQRYRAQGGPIGAVAQRFVCELGDADLVGISPDVIERLAMLAQAQAPLDEADQRWIRSQLPDIVRKVALLAHATSMIRLQS